MIFVNSHHSTFYFYRDWASPFFLLFFFSWAYHVLIWGKAFHRAKECTAPPTPPGDLRLCNNCYKQGHIAADCTNDKECNNCRKTGHLARECLNEPICNMCNVVGHVAGKFSQNQTCLEIWRSAQQWLPWHCMQELPPVWTYEQGLHGPLMTCHSCGGRGKRAIECLSGRMVDRYPQRLCHWMMIERWLYFYLREAAQLVNRFFIECWNKAWGVIWNSIW